MVSTSKSIQIKSCTAFCSFEFELELDIRVADSAYDTRRLKLVKIKNKHHIIFKKKIPRHNRYQEGKASRAVSQIYHGFPKDFQFSLRRAQQSR